SDGKKMMYYYGDVKVTYQNLEMTAAYMRSDIDTRIVFAAGIPDSTGALQGCPVMKEGRNTYTMDSIYYNFQTGKAKIFNMTTKEKEGIMHGTVIKKMPDNSLNISKGKYTTCDADHPHFYLMMTSAKAIQEPKRKTIFGPSYVVIEDVPTPFALPFGFVPDRPDRAGGLMMPNYGEEVSRGFFMRGLGYYFVVGEHLDFALTGDVYSLGSWSGQLTSRYKTIYRFDGSLQINTSNNITGERGAPDFNQSRDFSVRWTHNQDAKARPGTTFRASVNFSSPMNNRFNAQNINQARDNKAESSITYGKTFFGTPFNLSLNLQHRQNMRDSSYAFTLPNFTLTMSRITPFQRKERIGKEKAYEKISFNYSTTFDNKIDFKSSEFSSGELWSKFKNGMSHNFGIGLPSFTLLKYFQFNPTISYGMNWHFRKKEKIYNPETNREEDIFTDPFSVFGVTQNVSGGISASTRLYGMFPISEKGAIRAVRHMVTPQISLNFSPDMQTSMNGFTSLVYTDNNDKLVERPYNIYEGASTYGPLGGRKSAAMSFSLGNNLEAKVRNSKDTANNGVKKMKLIDNLSLSSSYNFLLDSFNLAPVSVSMNTTIFEKVGLNANATLDPYAINKHGANKIATFNIIQEGGFKLVRLTQAGFSFSYQFSGKGGASGANTYKRIYTHPITGEFIPEGWVYYMPPDLPWSVNLNYNYSYSNSYQFTNGSQQKVNNHLQTVGINSQIKLTNDFNLTLTTGVDMMKMKLSTTQLSATYDLHCFLISVSWVPQGKWSQWSFSIRAKSSTLSDLLKYDKKASFWDM
ncbi:MAG: LPS-assembly protein LptD, partial [Bacteroidales bacterium]|nr:LPS-assembly protein LptD [Bacteroidales bacterium]